MSETIPAPPANDVDVTDMVRAELELQRSFRAAFVRLSRDVGNEVAALMHNAGLKEHEGEWEAANAYRHAARRLRRISAGEPAEGDGR